MMGGMIVQPAALSTLPDPSHCAFERSPGQLLLQLQVAVAAINSAR
jgi:hypothetical protein